MFTLCNVPYVQHFTSFYLEANGLSNQHMYELFNLLNLSGNFTYDQV
jgi:hypothetical protein